MLTIRRDPESFGPSDQTFSDVQSAQISVCIDLVNAILRVVISIMGDDEDAVRTRNPGRLTSSDSPGRQWPLRLHLSVQVDNANPPVVRAAVRSYNPQARNIRVFLVGGLPVMRY